MSERWVVVVVDLMAFEEPGDERIRLVTIPCEKGRDVEDILNDVFHFGQACICFFIRESVFRCSSR